MRLRVLLGLLAFSLLALANRSRLQAWALGTNPSQRAGHRAPELPASLRTLDGQPVSIAALRGRVVLLHFWTFACGNCEHMVPSYNAWDAKLSGRGLRIIGVHTPELDSEHSLDALRATVHARHITWTVVPDGNELAWTAYGVHAWPTVFVIDRDGTIAGTFVGDDTASDIERLLGELLR